MFSLRLPLLFTWIIVGITLSIGSHAVCPLQAEHNLTQNTSAQARQKCYQLFHIGKKAYEGGDWTKAEPLLKQGLQLAEIAGEKALQADFLNLTGLVYYRRGQLLESLEYFRRALGLFQNNASSDTRILKTMRASAASVLNNMGNAADQLGQIHESLKYKQEAMTIRLAIGDKGKIADSTNALGIAYEHLSECDKALDFYACALKLYEVLQDQEGITDTCNNMGNVYDRLGEYEKALSVYQRSYDVATALDDKIGRAKVLNNMATTYESLGELDRALDLLHDAQRLQDVFGDIQERANTLNNIGNVYADKGNYDLAFDNLFHALELRKSIGNPQAIAETMINVGALYEAFGRLAEAQSLYEQAGKALGKSDDKSFLGRCFSNLANIAAKQVSISGLY